MNKVLGRKKTISGIVLVICGAGIAYSMDLGRTPPVEIRVSPVRDVAPSEVTMRVSTHLAVPVESIAWDFQGDGTFDAKGPNLHSPTVTFATGGHFVPRVVVTDQQGDTFEATAQVFIENPEDLQAALNARWKGMLAALAKQDIEGALAFVASTRRERMGHDWTRLKDHLGKLADTFDVPLLLTDGQGYRVVARSADPLPMGEIMFPLEVEFVWESDNQLYIRSY